MIMKKLLGVLCIFTVPSILFYIYMFRNTVLTTYSVKARRLLPETLFPTEQPIDPERLQSEFRSSDELRTLIQSYKAPHYMRLKHSRGRLGNQMFQFAFLVSTARRHGYQPLWDMRVINQVFDIPESKNIMPDNSLLFREIGFRGYNSSIVNLTTCCNWTLDGYFQAYKYHDNKLVDSVFRFRETYIGQPRNFLRNITEKGRVNIGIHIRRGDFLDAGAQREGYAVVDMAYINRSMEYMNMRFQNRTTFIIASNGMDWCKANIKGPNVYFSNFKTGAADLALMSLCDHVIISGGTFSWWAGRLTKGDVVYFKGFPTPGSRLSKRIIQTEVYPPHWKPL